jgi:hypothetical protein
MGGVSKAYCHLGLSKISQFGDNTQHLQPLLSFFHLNPTKPPANLIGMFNQICPNSGFLTQSSSGEFSVYTWTGHKFTSKIPFTVGNVEKLIFFTYLKLDTSKQILKCTETNYFLTTTIPQASSCRIKINYDWVIDFNLLG